MTKRSEIGLRLKIGIIASAFFSIFKVQIGNITFCEGWGLVKVEEKCIKRGDSKKDIIIDLEHHLMIILRTSQVHNYGSSFKTLLATIIRYSKMNSHKNPK